MSDNDALVRAAFPVLGSQGAKVDWQFVADHGKQAQRNHYQTVERLAQRGGLSWCELAAVIENREYKNMDTNDAIVAVRSAEAEYLAALRSPAPVVVGEKLGRFGHHPEADIDYDCEIEALIGMAYDRLTGMREQPDLEERIRKAMEFRVMETPLELRWLSQKFNGTREIYTKMPDCIARLEATRPQPAQDEVELVARAIHEHLSRRDIMQYLDNDEDCRGLATAAIAALDRHRAGDDALREENARLRAVVDALAVLMPIQVHAGRDYAEVFFADGTTHSTQAMTMNPQHWRDLTDAYDRAALTGRHP